MSSAMNIASRLESLRKSKGLSQDALAHRSGVSRGAIQGIEEGTSNPTINTLTALADALGVSLIDLLGGQPTPAPTQARPDPPDHVEPSESYDMIAASRAMKDALDMLRAFAELPPSLQKIALAVIYQDPLYLAGISPGDVPRWLSPSLPKLKE